MRQHAPLVSLSISSSLLLSSSHNNLPPTVVDYSPSSRLLSGFVPQFSLFTPLLQAYVFQFFVLMLVLYFLLLLNTVILLNFFIKIDIVSTFKLCSMLEIDEDSKNRSGKKGLRGHVPVNSGQIKGAQYFEMD